MSVALALLLAPLQAPPPVAPLSPLAEATLAAWRTKAAGCKAPLATMPTKATVAASLSIRVEAEQCLRRLLGDPTIVALPVDDRQAVDQQMWSEIRPVDAANTAWLKTVLPADGWFRADRDGADAAHEAWLIVQHSPDQAFQAEVLRRMEPLAKTGDARGGDYALLYDRVEMVAGRPQYYGSQYRCENGRWAPSPILDSAGVEARRRTMGLSTMADNLAQIAANGRC